MIFYHNITKQKFNITDVEDLLDTIGNHYEGRGGPQVIMFSRSGDAQIYDIFSSLEIARDIIERYAKRHYTHLDLEKGDNLKDLVALIIEQNKKEFAKHKIKV